MNIGIIGLGYVGLTLAIAAAESGINVYGTEINQHIKNCINQDKAHFYEPGLDSLIKKNNKKTFNLVNQFTADMDIQAYIITVGTPLIQGGKNPNFEYIKSAIKSIESVYTGNELIILRSTVSVGTTRNIVMPFLSKLCGKSKDDIMVSMCPERTIEGKAIEELMTLPQIISGNNSKAMELAQNLFRKITPYVIQTSSLEEAELVKLYCNTYRDINFSIGNVFCRIAQMFGVDGMSAIHNANMGYERAKIPLPGFVAGPCLEKDAYLLTNKMPEGESKNYIMGARKYNESLEDMVVGWVENRIGRASVEKVVVLSGMAFKGTPETSDLRGSSSVYIARKLKDKGYSLRLHDFVSYKEELKALNLGEVFDDIYDACSTANILLILNNHRRYSELECDKFVTKISKDFAILDAWKVCRNLYNSNDIDISTLGNMFIK